MGPLLTSLLYSTDASLLSDEESLDEDALNEDALKAKSSESSSLTVQKRTMRFENVSEPELGTRVIPENLFKTGPVRDGIGSSRNKLPSQLICLS